MAVKNPILLKIAAGLITFLIVYLIVPFLFYNDFLLSLTPGWHTTIYPFGGPGILTSVVLLLAILANLTFFGSLRILKKCLAATK